MASRWASERKGCRYMPPGSRLDLPAPTQGTSTRLSAQQLLRGLFHSLPDFERPATQPTPACRLVVPGACKRLAYIFPGFVFIGHLCRLERQFQAELDDPGVSRARDPAQARIAELLAGRIPVCVIDGVEKLRAELRLQLLAGEG